MLLTCHPGMNEHLTYIFSKWLTSNQLWVFRTWLMFFLFLSVSFPNVKFVIWCMNVRDRNVVVHNHTCHRKSAVFEPFFDCSNSISGSVTWFRVDWHHHAFSMFQSSTDDYPIIHDYPQSLGIRIVKRLGWSQRKISQLYIISIACSNFRTSGMLHMHKWRRLGGLIEVRNS